MTYFLRTDSRSAGGARAAYSLPTRGSSLSRTRPALSALRRREPGFPACVRSYAGNSFRPQAQPRSAHDCSRHLIRFTTTRCGEREPTNSSASACRHRRSNRSGKSERRSPTDASISRRSATWSADEAHAALTALHGVGPWTADIYLLFCLGHADAFPAGDLAVQESARIALGLRKRPDAKALTKMAEAWRPWRGVAAHLLWAYYHVVKKRDVVPVQPNGRPKEAASKKTTKGKKKNG